MPSPNRRNADVASLTTFRDANKFAVNSPGHRLYIVYSYGEHWPLLVFDRATGEWWANEDKYSATTSRHMTQCRPYTVPSDEFRYVSAASLRGVIETLTQDQLEDVPC